MHKTVTGLLAASMLAFTSLVPAQAQTMPESVVMAAPEIVWQPGPPSLPPGVEMTSLYGDPMQEGQFTMRFKMPAGYHIPPHTHPKLEAVTVLSGSLLFGEGESGAREAAKPLGEGSFFGMPAGMVHYVYAAEDTIIQLSSIGPWEIDYINPEDDPRNAAKPSVN